MGFMELSWECAKDWRVQAGCAALGMTAYLVTKRYMKYANLPPGPTPVPLLGNILSLMKPAKAFDYYESLKGKYGDVFTFYFGPVPCVFLNSQEVVKEAYLDQMNAFADRPKFYSVDLLSDGYKSIAMGMFTPEWKLQRKIVHSAIRNLAQGEQLESLVHVNIDNLVDMIQKKNEEAFDPSSIINLTMYNILSTICFGKTYSEDDEEFNTMVHIVDDVNESVGNGFLADIFPIFKYLPSPTVRKIKEALKYFKDWIDNHMDEHKQLYDRENVTDLTYMILKVMEDIKAEEGQAALACLTKEHLFHIIQDVFFAGTDTSRYTLMWVIFYSIYYPEVQAKMAKEIDEVLGNRRATKADRSKLHYVEAVLHEAMRIRPVAPLALPRVTCSDTHLRGYKIPKDTMVMMNIWALHMDPKYWDNPTKFNPDRFLDSNGKFETKPYSFLPFSTGRRVCVGESLARLELLLLVTTMYQELSFEAAPGENYEDSLDNTIDNALVIIPKPFKVIAKQRHQIS